jgi:hypothetical protein
LLSEDGKFVYHISIIDYLQKYDISKKCERLIKRSPLFGAKSDEISSIDTLRYGERFIGFMKEKVFNLNFCSKNH